MHAYLIMAHSKFKQLKYLINELDDPRNDIYVHIDKKFRVTNSEIIELLSLAKYSKIYLIERKNVVWGHFSQIECELKLLNFACLKADYEYLHLLSGMDFPIKSQDYIHNFFNINCGKEFIHFETKDIIESDYDKCHRFYPLQYFIGNKNSANSIFYIIQRILIKLQRFLSIEKTYNKHIFFCKGANWFSITGSLAKYVISKKCHIKKIFNKSLCCDEFFLQTIVMNSQYSDNIFDKSFANRYIGCMRKIDWERGNPYIFTLQDYGSLIQDQCLFARKFDIEKDKAIIEKLSVHNHLFRVKSGK